MLELNHTLTVLQAFLPQYWNWTHWPNKVKIFKKKKKKKENAQLATCLRIPQSELYTLVLPREPII